MVTWHRTIKHFPANSLWAGKIWNSELKQRRQRRLRKRYLKSEFGLLPTLSRLFHLVQFVKCWQFLLDMNSKRLYRSRGKEQESRCLVLTSSTKPEIRQFYIVVVRGNVQKSVHTQSCCFANLNLLLFLPTSLTSPSSSSSSGSLRYGEYGLRLRINMLLRMIKTT